MISSIIAMIIGNIQFRKMLKNCLIVEQCAEIELFEYKGKLYNKRKFIDLKIDSLKRSGISKKNLKKVLEQYENGLVNSKTPDLDMAFIEAYKTVL